MRHVKRYSRRHRQPEDPRPVNGLAGGTGPDRPAGGSVAARSPRSDRRGRCGFRPARAVPRSHRDRVSGSAPDNAVGFEDRDRIVRPPRPLDRQARRTGCRRRSAVDLRRFGRRIRRLRATDAGGGEQDESQGEGVGIGGYIDSGVAGWQVSGRAARDSRSRKKSEPESDRTRILIRVPIEAPSARRCPAHICDVCRIAGGDLGNQRIGGVGGRFRSGDPRGGRRGSRAGEEQPRRKAWPNQSKQARHVRLG